MVNRIIIEMTVADSSSKTCRIRWLATKPKRW